MKEKKKLKNTSIRGKHHYTNTSWLENISGGLFLKKSVTATNCVKNRQGLCYPCQPLFLLFNGTYTFLKRPVYWDHRWPRTTSSVCSICIWRWLYLSKERKCSPEMIKMKLDKGLHENTCLRIESWVTKGNPQLSWLIYTYQISNLASKVDRKHFCLMVWSIFQKWYQIHRLAVF